MKPLFLCLAALMIFSSSAARGQIAANDSSKTNQFQAEYEKWIAPYKQNSAGNRFSSKAPRPKLVISVVTEKNPSRENDGGFYFGGTFISGWEISAEGVGRWFSYNAFGTKGSCCSQIEKNELERIDQILADLPSDHARLPPNGRRLVLQIPENDAYKVRVYDLADAPDEILELLRLAKTGFRSSVLWFNPETQWTAADYSNDGGLAVTSDERRIISSGLNEPIKIWDANSRELIAETAKPQNVPFNGLILSPNDSVAAINGWGEIGLLDMKTLQPIRVIEEPFINRKRHQLSNPQFIENGKFLLIESDEPALQIYDTKTWRCVGGLPEIPREAISYYPARSKNLAVYQSRDGQIFLRDTKRGRNLAALDNAKIKYAAFSSDESLFAVVTVHPGTGNTWTRYRIRIWNAEGKFVKELLPFERDFCESVKGLAWSPDDKYILAANKADIFFTSRGISIWSVATGRHRGELQGCPTNLFGFGFLSGKNKIVAGCGDGIIRVWDLAGALAEIRKFEKQLAGG